ncbi:MAG: NYN domain-containing protein [Clostridia bacterium]|nr:NYN domain-containing protein [Clostridia bacterium]
MKSMAFIDYQNFEICKTEYLKSLKVNVFNINFQNLANCLNDRISLQPNLMKTFLFAYKPCDELLQLDMYRNYYNWLSGLRNKPFFEVIEGVQQLRPVNSSIPIDIYDNSTFKTKEKGTDINLAVNMLSKAYQNAYDIAILVSGDTDYIPVIKELHNLGKIVVLATFPTQNIKRYDVYRDAHIKIDIKLLKECIPVKRKLIQN